jgi:hypothetical protein
LLSIEDVAPKYDSFSGTEFPGCYHTIMQPRLERWYPAKFGIVLLYLHFQPAFIVGHLQEKTSILAKDNFLSVAKFIYLTYILAADNGSLSITEIGVMETLVGRVAEEKILSEALTSASAELIAVFGRRRVGKTFLIRSVYRKQLVFELSGVHNASSGEQLLNFSQAIALAIGLPAPIAAPKNWTEAFWV